MKKILSICLLALSLFAVMGCENDIDSNPQFKQPGDNALVLNVPPYAENNVYDLERTDTIVLTTSQPDYGYTAATNYVVQLSLDGNYADGSDFVSLPQNYDKARICAKGADFTNALNELWDKVKGAEQLPEQLDVYVRLRASVAGQTDLGVCYSNVIKLTVKPYTPPVTVQLPAEMYLIGGMPASDWNNWLPFHPVYDAPGAFYGVFYFSENANFKIGPDNGVWDTARTYDQITFVDNANAGLVAGTDNGNSQVNKAGWYTVVVTTKVKNDEVLYTVTFEPALLYVFGDATGGSWDYSDAWQFAVPADAEGDFVSPALAANGELRIAVRTSAFDWWRTEITFLNSTGAIYYRNENLISNWEGDLGADYSVKGTPGSTVHLNFATGTGALK